MLSTFFISLIHKILYLVNKLIKLLCAYNIFCIFATKLVKMKKKNTLHYTTNRLDKALSMPAKNLFYNGGDVW